MVLFDVNNWKTVIESGEDWMIIFSLVLIECLLSVDNAIVLAAQTQKLPDKKQQEKSLFYGLWGRLYLPFRLDRGRILSDPLLGDQSAGGRLSDVSIAQPLYRMKYPERAKRKKGKTKTDLTLVLVGRDLNRIDGYRLSIDLDLSFVSDLTLIQLSS